MSIPGITTTGTEADDQIKGTANDDKLYGKGGNDQIDGGQGDDLLDGGDGDDTLTDYGGNNRFLGGAGNDQLNNFGPGKSLMDGGAGDDTFIFGLEDTTVIGGDGNDTFFPREVNTGTARTHTIDGGAGDDYFQPYSRPLITLIMTGGVGIDTYEFAPNMNGGVFNHVVTDFVTGAGGDKLNITHAVLLTSYYMQSQANPFVAGALRLMQDGADTLVQMKYLVELDGGNAWSPSDLYVTVARLIGVRASSITADNIDGHIDPNGAVGSPLRQDGTEGFDQLRGTTGNDLMFGAGKADHLWGDDGHDELHGGTGDDWIYGDAGNDLVYGEDGADRIEGGEGNDKLLGGTGSDQIKGDGGDDFLAGENGNDQLDGGAGNDTLDGGDGDDLLSAGEGSNEIRGGNGLDRVSYTLPADGMKIQRDGGQFDLTFGTTTIDRLIDVERLAFVNDGMILALDIDGNAGQTYRLYQAAFDRTPDGAGLKYWINALDAGTVKLADMATLFVGSKEFSDMYGAAPSNATFLSKLYNNILHRAPDAAGYAYWLDVLDKKQATAPALLAAFSESPENVAALVGVIGDGFWYPA